MSQYRIREWYNHWGGAVYVSFSGGKDSTVLLHMARQIYPDIPAMFVNTGLEYPEVQAHVRKLQKEWGNIDMIRPEMRFDEVLKSYGYPVVSKEVSECVDQARKCLQRNDGKYTYRLARIRGELRDKKGNLSKFNCKKWQFLLDAPFLVSNQCCNVMKKKPAKKYERETGRKPIIGTMACESRVRHQAWMRTGCNAFESTRPKSQPMSFWTEQDVLDYIRKYNLEIPSVYGEIVETERGLKTTGCDRTGCIFCMFGCHLEKSPNRFQRLKETHPKQWEYCMRNVEDGGLGLKNVLDYIGVSSE